MRIALVVERFLPTGGGVEQAAWQVAHGLARAGDEVLVVARLGDPAVHSECRPPGCLSLRLVHAPRFWQPLRVAAFSHTAGQAVQGARPELDIVHSFTRTRRQDVYRAGAGSHADYMRRTYGVRGARVRKLSPRHRSLLAAEKRIFSEPQQVVQCVSRMVREEIATRFGLPDQRMVVIHNGVDHHQFDRDRHAEAARALRAELAHEDRTVWLLAGSGGRRKGIDTALAALGACTDESAILWIAGRDEAAPWRARAGALGLGERVHLLGERDDMPAVYAAADALLHPTRYDPFANVCLEAAASGIPVVTSGANGAAEVVGDAAIVVEDPEDVIGFARAMDRLADPALRSALGARGRKIALENGWDAHVAKLRELYACIRAGRDDPSEGH